MEMKRKFLKLHQKINYVGKKNLTKVKVLYAENYKTLIKKTEDDSKNMKISYAIGLEKLILLK